MAFLKVTSLTQMVVSKWGKGLAPLLVITPEEWDIGTRTLAALFEQITKQVYSPYPIFPNPYSMRCKVHIIGAYRNLFIILSFSYRLIQFLFLLYTHKMYLPFQPLLTLINIKSLKNTSFIIIYSHTFFYFYYNFSNYILELPI